MATTTNYGWTTPDDTGLVKDGASAIRSLGSSIDTTTKALNPSTTLGDIEYRSSTANTNTRLGIGTSGQVLSVSGGVPAWTTISGGGMTLISTINASAATSVSFTSIPSGYKNLVVVGTNISQSNTSGYFFGRLNGLTSGYQATALSANANNGTVQVLSTGSAFGGGTMGGGQNWNDMIPPTHAGSGNQSFEFRLTIYRYTESTNKMYEWLNSGNNSSYELFCSGMGECNTSSAITSFTLTRSGTQTITGNFYLYGVS